MFARAGLREGGVVVKGGVVSGFCWAEQRAEGEGIVVMLRGIRGFVRVCCFHAGVGAKEFIARIKIMC